MVVAVCKYRRAVARVGVISWLCALSQYCRAISATDSGLSQPTQSRDSTPLLLCALYPLHPWVVGQSLLVRVVTKECILVTTCRTATQRLVPL